MLESLLAWQLWTLDAPFHSAPLREAIMRHVRTHGDVQRWNTAIASLPEANVRGIEAGSCVAVVFDLATDPDSVREAALRKSLMQLRPWRKGPFRFASVCIDAEWRSDVKWSRLLPVHDAVEGAHVLDVGCGNGYYGWRMLAAGAKSVLGIDHNPLCIAQHLAVQRYVKDAGNLVLPVSLEEMPAEIRGFDVVLSMGVLSHSRDPLAHLRNLRIRLRKRGRAIVESLVLAQGPGELRVGGRYARMRNVWRLPGVQRLHQWIEQAGFTGIELLDISRTGSDEQRRTPWMPFESLAESLNPGDSSRTLEGLPAPRRAIFIARRP